jgi:hypothetical protein
MNLKKKCSVVMLPTNEKAVVFLTKDKFTIYEFIKLTESSYGGHIIKQLL